MNFINEYIIQSIVCASNNLRLSTEKIEIVTLIRQFFEKENDIALIIFLMKQKTEFSKFAVKLDTLYKFISKEKIDFTKITESFKEHCHFITQELGMLLDILSTAKTKELLEELLENKRSFVQAKQNKSEEKEVAGTTKDDEILFEDEEKEEFSFEDYEKKILKPIKKFDEFLNKLPTLNYTEKDINEITDLVKIECRLINKHRI